MVVVEKRCMSSISLVSISNAEHSLLVKAGGGADVTIRRACKRASVHATHVLSNVFASVLAFCFRASLLLFFFCGWGESIIKRK